MAEGPLETISGILSFRIGFDKGKNLMKLQFRHQQFQEDAARAVCDVFRGQNSFSPTFPLPPRGTLPGCNAKGFCNEPLNLPPEAILQNLREVQLANGLEPSTRLLNSHSSPVNLTIEMETGTGKTYTYIKTIYELNRANGWSKFIVVVPSIPVREGVFKTFQITADHFASEYGKKIDFFIYNSANMGELRHFAQNPGMNVMIINPQAFNARGKDARRIHTFRDEFGAEKPIEVIAATNPVLIIDEPQTVEGKVTREMLPLFNAMVTLRYSATHPRDSIYNMIYRLDSQDAVNRHLVKSITVRGIRPTGRSGANGYVFLDSFDLSGSSPLAVVEYERRGKGKVGVGRRKLKEGDNLYELSNGLEQYRDGYTITRIDASSRIVEFLNGLRLSPGDAHGYGDDNRIRRLQIRDTIQQHFAREERNFKLGIKTLSLFFIDEVAKYRQYDESGNPRQGLYGQIFEEEYGAIREETLNNPAIDPVYQQWLGKREAASSHAGYFSIDKKSGRIIDSKARRAGEASEDVDAYDLILKNRERLLDLDEPVRFIFSHSALGEGWDNPNVFQICALKQTRSDTRRKQEVGRGLRLCVNSRGERVDEASMGAEALDINNLVVVAGEAFESFAKAFQLELADSVSTRPKLVEPGLFAGRELDGENGAKLHVSDRIARRIHESLIMDGYLREGMLTEKFHIHRAQGKLAFPKDVAEFGEAFLKILDEIYRPQLPRDGRKTDIRPKIDRDRLASQTFRDLWAHINAKTAYTVDFDEGELVRKAIASLNSKLEVRKIRHVLETGTLGKIESREELLNGKAFTRGESVVLGAGDGAGGNVKYDLLGKMQEETGLTRACLGTILAGIAPEVFGMFRENPEEFILGAARVINNEKAALIIEHITYHKLDEAFDADIFTETLPPGKLGENALKTGKHLYDSLVHDSTVEKELAIALEGSREVELYVKLPKTFYIPTPMGHYSPDWAIAFNEGETRHIYFVAETKGSLESLQLREIERCKLACAREHFRAISSGKVRYGVISSYEDLLGKVLGEEGGHGMLPHGPIA